MWSTHNARICLYWASIYFSVGFSLSHNRPQFPWLSDSFFFLTDSWLVKYLSVCSFSEKEILLERLNETFVRAATLLSTVDNHAQRQNCFKFIETTNKHILPYIQQVFTESYEGDVMPKFAANLCLYNRFGVRELNQELFKSFVETQKTDIQ